MRFYIIIICILQGLSLIGQNLRTNSTLTYIDENDITVKEFEKIDSFLLVGGSIYTPQIFRNSPFVLKMNEIGEEIWKTIIYRPLPKKSFSIGKILYEKDFLYLTIYEREVETNQLKSILLKIDYFTGEIVSSYLPFEEDNKNVNIRLIEIKNDSVFITGSTYVDFERELDVGNEWFHILDLNLNQKEAFLTEDTIKNEFDRISTCYHDGFEEYLLHWSLVSEENKPVKYGLKRIIGDSTIQFEFEPLFSRSIVFDVKPISSGYIFYLGSEYSIYNIVENTFTTYVVRSSSGSKFSRGNEIGENRFYNFKYLSKGHESFIIDLKAKSIETATYTPLDQDEEYTYSYYDSENKEIYVLGSNSEKSFFIKRIPRDSSNACVDRKIEMATLFVDEYPIELLPNSTEFIPYEGGKNLNITALDFPEHQFEKVLTCSEDLQPKVNFTVSDSLLYKNQLAYFTAEFQNPPDSVYWVFENGFPATSISVQPDSIYYPIEGCHRVSLYATNQYGDDELVKDCYIYVAPSVGVSDQNNPVKVFPTLISPGQSITIEHSGEIQSIQVYNTQGSVVSSFLEEINTNTYSMQIQQFIPGVYFLQIILEDGRKENRKVVVTD